MTLEDEKKRTKVIYHAYKIANIHNRINSGKLRGETAVRVLMDATESYENTRGELLPTRVRFRSMADLESKIWSAGADAGNRATWPAWLENIHYDLCPEESGHEDVRGRHAALWAMVEALFPSDEEEAIGGLKSLHKGRRW